MTATLPRYKRVRPEDVTADALSKLDEATAVFGEALTGETGILTRTWLPRAVVRVISATVPDPWVPLTLVPPFARHPNASFPPPAWKAWQEGSAVRVRTRGLLTHPGPAPAFGTPMVTGLPIPLWQARHAVDGNNAHALVETLTNGNMTYGVGDVSTLSLEGVEYEVSPSVLRWDDVASPFVTYGDGFQGVTPTSVQLLDAAGADGLHTGPLPVRWEHSRIGQFPGARIRYIHGLSPGKYTLRFLIASE